MKGEIILKKLKIVIKDIMLLLKFIKAVLSLFMGTDINLQLIWNRAKQP